MKEIAAKSLGGHSEKHDVAYEKASARAAAQV